MKNILILTVILTASIIMFNVGTMPGWWLVVSLIVGLFLGMTIGLRISGHRQWRAIGKAYREGKKP